MFEPTQDTLPPEPRARRPGLRTLLLARVLAPLVIVLGGGIVVGFGLLERQVEDRMEDDVALVARAIRLPLVHALEGGSAGGVDRVLGSAFQIRRVFGAYVYGRDGEPLAAWGATPDEPRWRLRALLARGDRSREYTVAGGERVFSYFLPLTDSWGRNLGLLQVTRLRRDIDRDIAALRIQALLLLAGTLLLVTFLVVHGQNRAIVRPLRDLVGGMRRIREGASDTRIDPRGAAELQEVARGFNTMMDSLGQADGEIHRRRMEEARLARELAEAERMAAIGELAAGVAHELGTPLGVVDGAAQRLQRRVSDEEDRRLIEVLRGGVSRTSAIVMQLMEFGRRGDPRTRTVDVDTLTGAAVAAHRDEGARRAVQVETAPTEGAAAVDVDPRQLVLALGHLLRNAIHAAREHVAVSARVHLARVQIVVDDDGPGVPEPIRPRIFDPFFTTRRNGEGTGLGLAVVGDVVRAHGGTVRVEDSPLGGARFILDLPLADPGPSS